MSIEDPRLSSIDNTSAADDFDSAVEQHLGYASETAGGIEVAQAETPDATRTDRLPAQTPPVEVAAATIPTEVKPNEQNVVTLPAGIELDNLEFEVDGENLVLVLADGTEIVVLGGAANIPTFVIGDVELPQVALFAALEGSNINVAAGPDGTFSAQGTPSASRNFNDDPIDAGPEDLALADLLGDTSFGDELRTGVVFGGDGRPSIPSPLTESFIYDEAVIAGGEGQKIITGRLPFNPGPDSGAISAIGFVGASDVNEGDGLKVLTGFTSGGLPISVTGVSAALTGPDFVALEGRDSDGGLVFTISVNRATGDFTFELVGKLEHPDAGQNGSQDDLDDLLRLGFTYTVTDLDGDFVVGSFNIDVQDDAPTILEVVEDEEGTGGEETGTIETLVKLSDANTVSEDDLDTNESEFTSGNLGIRWGADDDLKSETLNEEGEATGDDPVGRTLGFTGLNTESTSEEIRAAIPDLANLSSDGFRLSYRIEYTRDADDNWNGGYRLVAYKDNGDYGDYGDYGEGMYKVAALAESGEEPVSKPDYPISKEYGETVFVITLDPTTTNGTYTFELIGNLDHYTVRETDGGSNNDARLVDVEADLIELAELDLEIPFTATDSDGDSVDGQFTVRVEDDEPVVIGEAISHTVDEDDISTIGGFIPGESLGTSPNDGNADGSYTGNSSSNRPGPATVSGSFAGMVDFGADDEVTTYSIIDEEEARATLTALGLTSKGGELSFDVINGTLYAFVNAGAPGVEYNAGQDRLVFSLEVRANGGYAFKLYDQLDHDKPLFGSNENTDLQDDLDDEDVNAIDFGSVIQATDFDGDSVLLTNSFSVTIRDDVPELVRGASEDRTVDEDDISTIGDRFPGESLGTSPNDGNADGSFTGSQGNNQPGPAFISGSLASLVKSGADESLTFSFINGDVARGMLESLGLSSKGAELSYEIRNGVLYAFDNAGSELGKSYDPQFGDRLVFELKLNGNGSYEFRLYDQLDHDAPGDDFRERPTNSDENFDLQDGLWFKDVTSINFGALIKATDYDGDSVSLNDAFSIKIRDDVPELSGKEENRLVDEDDIKNLQSTGNFPNDGNGDGSFTGSQNSDGNGPANISGSLASLIKGGADDTVKFSFINENTARATLDRLGLRSEGAELSYDIRDGVLYAFDNAGSQKGDSYDPDNGDRLVFKLTLSENGSYTFELVDQLDHDKPYSGADENTDLQDNVFGDVEAIDFGSIIKATDFDGDSVVLKDAFSITVKDDVPVLSGTKEDRIIDEDDISTLGMSQPGESLGTSPNDGATEDQSYTDSPSNNQPGPAYISGSLATLVRGGADDPITFSFINETAIRNQLSLLGLSSKGSTLSYDLQSNGVLYAFDNKGPFTDENYDKNNDRLVFSLKLNSDGSYEFRLFDQLDHDLPFDDNGDGQGIADQNVDLQDKLNNADVTAINFGKLITATDYDGDTISLDGAFSIKVRDDVPTAVARNTSETLVVDETAGQQNDDVAGPLTLFNGVANKGTDPNMSAQFAQQTGFVASEIEGGADDDVKIDWALKLNGADGLASGLMTTDGRSIMLFLEGDLIVGRYDSPTDNNSAVNASDPAAFALHLSDNGTLSMVQYVSIKHDDPADHDENDDANDNNLSTVVQSLAGKLNAVLTVTDYDGDKAVSEVSVGDRIQFQDDGPSVKLYDVNTMRIISDDDTVIGRNGNPGFGSSTTDGSFTDSKEYNKTGTLQFSAGADGATVAWNLADISVLSGATGITFAVNSSGTLLIFQNQGGVSPVQIAQVTLNSVTGSYVYTQTANLLHTAGGDENEAEFKLGFKVTDGDGDTADGKLTLLIDDDTPVVKPYDVNTMRIISDDDTVVGRNGNPGFGSNATDGSGSDSQEYNKTGTLQFSAGADGATVAWNLADISVLSGATGITFAVNSSGTLLIFQNQGGVSPVQIAQVTLNSVTGSYVYTQTANLLHTAGGDENEAEFKLGFKVTDGDGDTADGKLTLLIDDDTPVVKPYDVNTMRIISDDDTVVGRNGNPGFGSNATDGSGSDSQEYNKTGTLQFSAGADGATVAWNLADISVLSGATGITFAVNSSGTLLIFQNQGGVSPVQIAQVTLNSVTGSYVYTQTANLLHTAGGDENEAEFKLGFKVTDGDGDTADGKLTLLIDDDTPVVKPYDVNTMRIISDDDTVVGRNGNPGFGSNATDGSGSDSQEYNKTGTLQFSAGADGATVAWNLADISVLSGATGITFAVNSSGTLLIFQNQGGVSPVQIAQVTLNSVTGSYVYTQTANLLHTAGGDENEAEFKLGFKVTDGDGDTADGKLTLLIDDDTPVVKPYDVNTMRIISDDDTVVGRNGNPGFGSNATDGSGSDSQEYNKTGTLQFSAGADGATVAWNLADISVLSGATGITFAVNSSGTLLIFQNQGGVSPVQIAQVTLNSVTGSYVYTQTANLLHTAGGDENEAEFKLGFKVTDGDGDTADGKLTLLIDDDTPTLVSAPTTGLTLDEDDLPLGNDDGPAKEGLSTTGNLSISLGADGGSVALSAPNANWDPVYKTLTASDWSWKITLNSNGTYKFDLLKNTLEHGPGDDLENTWSVNVTYTATDGDGDIESGSFEIKIVDDVPVAVGESATVREASPVVGGNLILAFDVSGSMDEDAVTNGRYESKLDVAKAAALNLLASSDAASVLIVTFNDSARSSIWMSKADAIAYINGQIPNEAGGTNYDSAIQAIMTSAKPASTVYFFSDGNAGGGSYSLDDAETVAWQNFVNSNGMTSYAVGVGSGLSANDADLSDVAHPGNPIVITTANDAALLATVVPTPQMPTTASGFVLDNDSFGADGGRIQSIVVDGVTHTWDGTEGNKVLNVTTALGGSLIFNFKTGAWSYAAPSELDVDSSETFNYVIVDGDGDTATASLTINLEAVNDAPVNTVPSSLTAAEDTELVINGISVDDVDANGGDITVKLEVEEGKLTLATSNGLVVSGNNSDMVTLTGSVSAINAALTGMKYKGDLNFNGADQLKITTTDNGNTGIGGAKTDVDTVAITVTAVNDAPVLSPETREIEFTEDGSGRYLFSNVNVSDVDNPANFNGGSIEISLDDTAVEGDQIYADNDIRLSGSNVQVWSGGYFGNWVTIGTLASGGFGQTSVKIDLTADATESRVEFFLASILYKSTSDNPTDADRTVTVTFSDGGNTGAGGSLSDTSTITVKVNPVNDAPEANGDRIITNAGVGTTFEIPDWALLFNDTDVDSDDLTVTSISDRVGLSAATGSDGVIVVDTGSAGGRFNYRASDGELLSNSVRVTVEQDTTGPLNGTSGGDILVGVAKPLGQITTIKFANSYDVGDVVKITLDGKTFSHTVVSGGTTASAVYNALKTTTAVGGTKTLQQLLAEEGITDVRSDTTVTWTGLAGADNAFDVAAEVDNSNDVGTKWHYEVDFADSIWWFEASGTIAIKIGSQWYYENANNSGVSTGNERFDKTAEVLAAELRGDGFDITYNGSSNSFLIKTNASTAVDGAFEYRSNRNWSFADVDVVQTGSTPLNQADPLVETVRDAADGGVTMNGLGGDDILIGSDGDDIHQWRRRQRHPVRRSRFRYAHRRRWC